METGKRIVHLDPGDACPGWERIIYAINNDLDGLASSGRLHRFRPVEVKEKYGELRVYWDAVCDDTTFDDISALMDSYAYISSHTCAYCGAFPVPMTYAAGWYLPLCRSCYGSNVHASKAYDDAVCEHGFDSFRYKCVRYTGSGTEERSVDVTAEIEKIKQKKG